MSHRLCLFPQNTLSPKNTEFRLQNTQAILLKSLLSLETLGGASLGL